MSDELRVLALGAGVQSSTLLLMAVRGEIEQPDLAIFSDTQWEPASVYRHLDWLEIQALGAGIPVERVTAGNLRDDVLSRPDAMLIPLHITNPDGSGGMGPRKCTRDYKVRPIRRAIRKRYLARGGTGQVEQWFGISLDEVQRMKPSDVQYIRHRYPLIERRMTRHDCLLWLQRHDYPEPPKSACIGCPFHDDRRWRAVRDEVPDEWADVVALDAAIRTREGMHGHGYLHRKRLPLADVDLSTPEDRGQLNLWDIECEGYCGV